MRFLKNIKLIFRNLGKNKTVTGLNIFGLTVGLTTSMLVFFYVMKEKSTDKFIPSVEKIYCLTNEGEIYLSQNMVNLVKEEIPEIDKITYCSVDWSPQIFLDKEDQKFKVEKMLTADSSFFRVFQFKAVWGNPATALNASNKLVITRSLSEKIFGTENPVGKTVIYNATYLQGEPLEISAVIEDFPQASSWDFEAVLSFQTNYKIDWYVRNMQHWGTQNYKGFVRINENLSQEQVLSKLSSISLDKVPDDIKSDIKFSLYPYSNIYFDLPELTILKHGNRLTVSIIGITGLLILLLACINYVNMVTAQREKRNKSIGLIKIMGGNRKKVIEIITTESFMQVIIASFISLFLAEILLPTFNNLTSSSYTLSEFISIKYILLLLFIIIVMIAITGIIPGMIFSKQSPHLLLKGQLGTRKGNNSSRNALLIFQFIVTIALISSIFVINKQGRFLQSQDLGFDKSSIIYANTNNKIDKNVETLKNELQQIPGIDDFTFSQTVLVDNDQNWGRGIINKGENYDVHFSKLSVAPNFFSFFGINIKEGRTFNENSKKNKEYIFNQTAKKQFKIENIENAKLESTNPHEGHVVGIIEDYNFESLHVPIRAAGYMCSGECDEVLYLKLNNSNITDFNNTIHQVENIWNKISPDFPMEYQFLDKKWEAHYSKDNQFQKTISYTTIISLLLSCLGLVGLTFYVMEQKIKEIGVRKVNGAKITEILTMLNKDFIKWVVFAFVIACPVAWFTMNKWLENFAYKTELSWWIFALAGAVTLIIALATVSWQSWRAANKNPVEALRYE